MSSILDWQIDPDNNDRSDQNINWREGQPPSSVNNSARGMMGRCAEFIQDSLGYIKAEGGPFVYSARTTMNIKKLDFRIAFNCIFAQRPKENATLNLNSLGDLPLLRRTETLSEDSDQSGFTPLIGNDVLAGVPYHVRFIAPEYLKDYPKGAFFIADAETKPVFLKKEGFLSSTQPYQKFYYKKDGLVRQWGYIYYQNVSSAFWTTTLVSYLKPFKNPIAPLLSGWCSLGGVRFDCYAISEGPYPDRFVVYVSHDCYYKERQITVAWQASAYEPD